MAETIWCEGGKKADVGSATEKFSLESGKCVEDEDNTTKNVEDDADNPTKKRKIEDDTPAHLSSSDEEEDQETAKAIAPAPAPNKTENVETMKKIPPMAPKVANKIDMPTVTTSRKRSHTRASCSDFLEAFHLSILQDKQQREDDRELWECN